MTIRYTRHAAIDKFAFLARHDFVVTKAMIRKVITNPDHSELGRHPFQTIVSKQIDDRHVLRVVYRKEGSIITVITFYPAQTGRYYV